MTQLEYARKGIITPEMARVAVREKAVHEFDRGLSTSGLMLETKGPEE